MSLTALCIWIGVAAAQEDLPDKKTPTESVQKPAGQKEKLRAALDKRLDWDFEAVPLASVVRKLREQTALDIRIDEESIKDAGIETDRKFSLKAKKMSLRAGLNHLLRAGEVGWGIDDGKLVIAAADKIASLVTTEAYSLTDLLPKGATRAERKKLAAEIVSAVQHHVSPDTWGDSGGEGSISSVGNRLVVKHNWQSHEQLGRLLARLKEAKALVEAKDVSVPLVASWRIDDAENEGLERLLKQPADWPFEEIGLAGFITFFEDRYGVSVQVNDEALTGAGLTRDVELKSRIAGLSVEQALSRLLISGNLSWSAQDEAIVITSRDEAESTLEYRVYPVADLIGGDERSGKVDLEKWSELVVAHLAANTWIAESSSLPGPFATLFIPQTRETHAQIAAFLTTIRKLRSTPKEAAGLEPIEMIVERKGPARAALDKEASFDFREVSLAAAAEAIAAKYAIPVLLDEASLDDYGIDKEEPIGEQALMLTLAKALDKLLGPLELFWCVRDGALVITAEEQTRMRFYPVHDLLDDDTDATAAELTEEGSKLKSAVESNAAPDSWSDSGGSGVVNFLSRPTVLIITQTETGHREVELLLKKLRDAKGENADEKE